MQQGGQYPGSLYPSHLPPAAPAAASVTPDLTPPYTSPSTYVPSYSQTPAYYASSHLDLSYKQIPSSYAPQAPPYTPPQANFPDSFAPANSNVNNPPPSQYPAHSNPYTPAVPPYENSLAIQNSSAPTPNMSYPPAPSQNPSFAQGSQPYVNSGYGTVSVHGGYPPTSPGAPVYGTTQQGLQALDRTVGMLQDRPASYDQVGSLYSQGGGYDTGGYGHQGSYEQSFYDRPSGADRSQIKGGYNFSDTGLGEVYAYDGGHTEPYGSRGTAGDSWGVSESFNRPSSSSGSLSYFGGVGSSKMAKAVPNNESKDGSNGVQKYRVKLLADSSSSSGPTDVLCQIGLDGVRLITPSTNKTIRIYPLDTITRWEVSEPSVFTFWAKSSVDVEARRIRLQSSSYTTNAILDTLTAACVQFSEMVGKDGLSDVNKASSDTMKESDQNTEKKKSSLADWVSFRARLSTQEEKQHWVPDEAVTKCTACGTDFGAFVRRHHCRNCGDIFCDKCTQGRTALSADEDAQPVRVCDSCLAEVTQRLANMKEINTKATVQQTHEDLAKKLQEEMERNAARRSSARSGSGSSVKERSGQTSVLNCNACGSISLVTGNSMRCPSCGADPASSRNLARGSNVGSFVPQGPPHLWPHQSNSEGSGKRLKEVACPTCTVHLQVQIPNSGTETVECGVCQHPFLVSAH